MIIFIYSLIHNLAVATHGKGKNSPQIPENFRRDERSECGVTKGNYMRPLAFG